MSARPESSKPLPSRQSLSDSIYEILLDQLVDGTIKAGSAMNIESMAREFDVSPTPIREALARLEATGLVERQALKGYRAAPLFTTEQLVQLMTTRLIIEAPATRLACLNADDSFVRALHDNVQRMRVLAETKASHGQYRHADEEFHDLIAQQADNPFLFRAYKSLEAHVQRFRLFGALGASDVAFAVEEHSAILDAISRRDAELAETVMSEHILHARARALDERKNVAD